MVLYLVQNFLRVAVLREEKQSGGVFDGDATDEAFLDEVVVAFGGEGFGKSKQAAGADVVFIVYQRGAANAAEAREEEFDEVAKPGHRNGHCVLR